MKKILRYMLNALRHIFCRDLSGSTGGNSSRAIKAIYKGKGNGNAVVWEDPYIKTGLPTSTVVSGYQLYINRNGISDGLDFDNIIPIEGKSITYSNPTFQVLTKNTVTLYEIPNGVPIINEEDRTAQHPYNGTAFSAANGLYSITVKGNANGVTTSNATINFPNLATNNHPCGVIEYDNIYALPKNIASIDQFVTLADKVNVGNGNSHYYQATNPYAIWGKKVGYTSGITDSSFENLGNGEYNWRTTGYNSAITVKAIDNCAVNITMENSSNSQYALVRLHNLNISIVDDIIGEMSASSSTVKVAKQSTGSYTWWKDISGGSKIIDLYKGDCLVIIQTRGNNAENVIMFFGGYANGSTQARLIDTTNGRIVTVGSDTTSVNGLVEVNGGIPASVTLSTGSTNYMNMSTYVVSMSIPSAAGTYTINCTTTTGATALIGKITKSEAPKKMTITGSASTIDGVALPTSGDTNNIEVVTPVEEDLEPADYLYVTFTAKQNATATLSVSNNSQNTAKCFFVTGVKSNPIYGGITAATAGSKSLVKDQVYTIGIVFGDDTPRGTARITISTT